MKTVFRFVLIFTAFIIVNGRRECVQKNLGNDRIICVCNMTYCDDLDPIVKQMSGIVTVFESNKIGDRFKESKLKFNHSINDTNHNNSQIIVTIDRNKTFQKIIGFGGAFTDAAGINIVSLPMNMAENIIKDYFSPNGIEYTLGRVPMAGVDFSTHPYSYDDHKDDFNLTHFSLTEEDYKYKIPLIIMAKQMSIKGIRLFSTPWSPPAWMKRNGQFNNGSELIGTPGGQYYQIFANYFVKFLDAYKLNGIEFWGITPENEPSMGYKPNHTFNDLGMTPELQRDFIKLNLGPTLEKAGYGPEKLKIMIHDDSLSLNHSITQWADTVFNDKDAAKFASGIAFHWYHNHAISVEVLDKVHESHPNKFILSTEACLDFGHPNRSELGQWSKGESYAHDIINDLKHWSVGWVEWNLALDAQTLGPTWAHKSAWSPVLVNASLYEYYKLPPFYVLGHFSKFLIPDSVRIQLSQSLMIKNFETIAFERPDNSIVIIAFNANDHIVSLKINDPKFGIIIHNVSAHSIQSYIYWN